MPTDPTVTLVPIQGFLLTTESELFDLPGPTDIYVDQTGADRYVSADGLDVYESE